MKKNKIIIGLVALFIGLTAGLFFGVFYGQSKEKDLNTQKEKEILREVFSGLMVSSLSGKIVGVSSGEKFLEVEVAGVLGVNLPKGYQNKKVVIAENTKVFLRENNSLEVFNKKVEDYRSETEKAKNLMAVIPPPPYSEKEIRVDDLRVGDSVSFDFILEENKSILDNEFKALRINISR